jgi:hypothetical protein
VRFDHLCVLINKLVQHRYRRRNLYQPLKPNVIRLPICRNPPLPAPPLSENREGFIHLSRGEKRFFLAWFAESHNHVLENISSTDHLTSHKAKERILNLLSNQRSPSVASSKNSKPQYEPNAGSSSNGQNDQKKKKGPSSASNSGGKECNWCCKHSPGTASSHIETQCKELKAWRDRNGAEMAAPIQEVANTVISNSSK